MREGSEEYLNSEKYEIKHRALDGPMLPLIQRVNAIRKENEALQSFTNITFLDTANDALIAYAKRSRGNAVITVVSIDPHQTQEGLAIVPADLGLPELHRTRPARPTSAISGASGRTSSGSSQASVRPTSSAWRSMPAREYDRSGRT